MVEHYNTAAFTVNGDLTLTTLVCFIRGLGVNTFNTTPRFAFTLRTTGFAVLAR